MGNITITIPQNIYVNYTVNNRSLTKTLLEWLNDVLLQSSVETSTEDRLLGLFSGQERLIEEITEDAMQSRETAQLRVE
jgi:hypothetical protein